MLTCIWNTSSVATTILCRTSKHISQLTKYLWSANFPLVTSWVPDRGYFVLLRVRFPLPCKFYLPQHNWIQPSTTQCRATDRRTQPNNNLDFARHRTAFNDMTYHILYQHSATSNDMMHAYHSICVKNDTYNIDTGEWHS